MERTSAGPLAGLRILEIGHYIAAPFASRLLADLGADVIKVEPPGGDPARAWGERIDGHSIWWSMHGRNKRSIMLDLKSAQGIETVKTLAKASDALIENFRPGQLEKLGIGPDVLHALNPALVIARLSGFGQDGPARDHASFGVIGEAIGGLRHLTNHPPDMTDLPPVRCGISIGDSVAGLYAALGVMSALWQRDRAGSDGKGRLVDVALTEAVLSLTEGMIPEYGALGLIRQPTGAGIPTAAPSSAYPTRDGDWMLIGANSEPLFGKLTALMGKPELAEDPDFHDNPSRCHNRDRLDAAIGDWTRTLDIGQLGLLLEGADIPHSKIYNAADCARDEQFLARGMVQPVDDPLVGPLLHVGVVPRFDGAAGAVRWTGPALDQHGNEIRAELAELVQ